MSRTTPRDEFRDSRHCVGTGDWQVWGFGLSYLSELYLDNPTLLAWCTMGLICRLQYPITPASTIGWICPP
ncbi:hypothetical protein H9L39_20280 [Fusarium oxysporum f. sp. albedinis]|nr:hypothetical protein H9L39_20280 [Fusarium oxysporum f. sp. albedinis]